jgi:D-ribose pyranose/furanose isomerase RbsD
MDILMERVQLMKHENDLRDKCGKVKQHLRRKEKDLFVAETRLACEIKEKNQVQNSTACLESELMKTAQEIRLC